MTTQFPGIDSYHRTARPEGGDHPYLGGTFEYALHHINSNQITYGVGRETVTRLDVRHQTSGVTHLMNAMRDLRGGKLPMKAGPIDEGGGMRATMYELLDKVYLDVMGNPLKDAHPVSLDGEDTDLTLLVRFNHLNHIEIGVIPNNHDDDFRFYEKVCDVERDARAMLARWREAKQIKFSCPDVIGTHENATMLKPWGMAFRDVTLSEVCTAQLADFVEEVLFRPVVWSHYALGKLERKLTPEEVEELRIKHAPARHAFAYAAFAPTAAQDVIDETGAPVQERLSPHV